jgi:hypothetical protein
LHEGLLLSLLRPLIMRSVRYLVSMENSAHNYSIVGFDFDPASSRERPFRFSPPPQVNPAL